MNRTSGCPVLKSQKMRTGWPHQGALLEISKLLNKKKGIWVILTRAVVKLKFCMGVQEEGMGVEEEFVNNGFIFSGPVCFFKSKLFFLFIWVRSGGLPLLLLTSFFVHHLLDKFFMHPNTLFLHLHIFWKWQNCPCGND